MIIVTGGAGFIGSNFILKFLEASNENLLNLDNLSYAANLSNLKPIDTDPRYSFTKINIQNQSEVEEIVKEVKPRAILNFAAESHVDRSIEGPESFINTNILGTYSLLEAALNYWNDLDVSGKKSFRFFHISTDEVFGSLDINDKKSTEESSYKPNSPYSASKAASDHLVRAWHHTFKLPTLVSNCTNNYGPHQHEEKLIPLIITKALKNEDLPIYGDGKNIRDWLYVEDHCEAIMKILENGNPGETYNIGGNCEKNNLEVVSEICKILDSKKPKKDGSSYVYIIKFVIECCCDLF
jgi:dTDP-glucose 4,6-dehydratase